MPKNIYYVSPHGEKGWKIMKQNATKASYVFATKAEAMEKAREFCKTQEATVIVKDRNGKHQETIRYNSK